MNQQVRILEGRCVSGPVAGRLWIDGRPYVNFFGAGYLALSGITEIRSAVAQALVSGVPFAQHVPASLGASDPVFEETEAAAAQALGTEDSVYFASGYLIGAVALASLEGNCGLLLVDEHAHYNLKDAARQLGIPVELYSHCDADALRDAISANAGRIGRPVVLTDGTFATTGAVPPLGEYQTILEHCGGVLVIDDSHGFGVVGRSGRGAAEHCGVIDSDRVVVGATLSKAYCAHGAVIGCSATAAKRVREVPPIRGTSAGSPLSAVAASAALRYVGSHPELRHGLDVLTSHLRRGLRNHGIDVLDSPAPIVAFRVGDAATMREVQRRAFERGVFVYYSTYIGAGPHGVIRCALYRDHTPDDLDLLIEIVTGL